MAGRPSILFLDALAGEGAAGAPDDAEQPDFFPDLNLDQVVGAITAGYDQFRLAPLFWSPLHDADAVAFRQEVARDLEDPGLFAHVAAFADGMRAMRSEITQSATTHNPHQGQRWHVNAAAIYVGAVSSLERDLREARLASRGLRSVRENLTAYVASPEFTGLARDIDAVTADLDSIRYRMDLGPFTVTVSQYAGEGDYSADVLATFERFKQGEVRDHRTYDATTDHLTYFEDRILALVIKLFPDEFASLAAFPEAHRSFVDPLVSEFDRELHFYVAYLQYLAPLRAAGLPFCYPTLSATSKRVDVSDGFDLALADKQVRAGAPVVPNDVTLAAKERMLVVTGPNQGGKTTFARMFGQLHYLASLGLPVPGTVARLPLADGIFTHFEKEEDLATLSGKLEDDLVRLRDLLDRATPRSVIVLNEMFTSTTLADAVFLGANVLKRIIALDALCVCVTFVDEFASLSASTVSMMSTVADDDATRRTFRIVRKPADGLAYADAIAHKHNLGYATVKARLRA